MIVYPVPKPHPSTPFLHSHHTFTFTHPLSYLLITYLSLCFFGSLLHLFFAFCIHSLCQILSLPYNALSIPPYNLNTHYYLILPSVLPANSLLIFVLFCLLFNLFVTLCLHSLCQIFPLPLPIPHLSSPTYNPKPYTLTLIHPLSYQQTAC